MDINNKKLTRFLSVSSSSVDEASKTVKLAFSSEEPVERSFGIEILDHSPSSVDLTRMLSGAPLLVDHDATDQVGVVERVSIDQDRVGRVVVRFGNSARAKEVYQDISEGIRQHVSVGYQILDARLEKRAQGGEELDTYRVTNWRPYEVSIVSIPADITVGVGRSHNITQENSKMSQLDFSKERADELERIDDIRSMGASFNKMELANEHIRIGTSVETFRSDLLKQLERETVNQHHEHFTVPKDDKRKYSLVNVIRSLSGDNTIDIGYEREVNQEMQHQKGGKSKGFSVPISALAQRDITAAGAGSSLVNEVYMPNMMVDFLRNKSCVINAGGRAIQLQGGDIVIPRQTGTATAEWLDLDGTDEITASAQTFDQLSLNMKSLTAMTTYTHRMLKQGLPDVESIIMQDLANLFAVEIDKAAINGAAANSKVPTGILNQSGILTQSVADAGNVPTFAEVIGFEGALANANVDTTGAMYITTPNIAMSLKATPKDSGSGMMIWESSAENEGRLNGYKACYSNNMPAGQMLFGNFSDLIIGYWGSLDLTVNPYGDNFSKGSVTVRAIWDLDMNVRRPQSFCKAA